MTKTFLIQQMKHHIKRSYVHYETGCNKFMLAEFYQARVYFDLICKFYICKEMFIKFALEVLGENAHKWADKIYNTY